MNDNSNIKLAGAITQLRLAWYGKHGSADNDPATHAQGEQMGGDVADQIDAMIVRAAQCGAAYGIVSRGG
jgi:hypothetical protein